MQIKSFPKGLPISVSDFLNKCFIISYHFIQQTNQYEGFNGSEEFILLDEINTDFLEELLFRTPGYSSWQEPIWLAHCNDFCQYLGEMDGSGLLAFISNIDDSLKEAVVSKQKSNFLSKLLFCLSNLFSGIFLLY